MRFFLDAGRTQWFIIYFLLDGQSAIIFLLIFDAFEFELISILSLGCWLKVDWQMSLVVPIEGFYYGDNCKTSPYIKIIYCEKIIIYYCITELQD